MAVFNFIKKYKIILFVILLLLSILGLFYLINSNTLNLKQNTSPASSYKGFDVLVKGFDDMDKDQTIPKNSRYQNLKSLVFSLQDTKISKKEKYDNLVKADNSLFDAYYLTKNDKLYAFHGNLRSFVQANFPEYFKDENFRLVCFSKTCADSAQPEEILTIIEQIQNSSLPDEVKKIDSEILDIYTYSTKEQASARVDNYFFLAQMIKNSEDYKKAGLNNLIYDEIVAYLKKDYPELLFKTSGIK